MSQRVCLIVDDEPVSRAVLRILFQREGFETLEAESAAQALGLAGKLRGALNLVVTDIHMPGDMNGLDLAYAIRRDLGMIPVLLISGFPAWKAKCPLSFRSSRNPLSRRLSWRS